tara:strand:- start:15942 stop:18722 length:2781 start_codon:yes stop_codon:yes gene_type:complete
MEVYNAMQLKGGKKAKHNRMGNITQPIQFLPTKEKDDDWAAWNMDWLEWEGLKQIRRNANRIMQNYKHAEGIIDKGDYIVETDNEYRDIAETLSSEEPSALELKYFPIIPNVIRVLVSEFAKRNKRVSFRAVDEYTYNEMLSNKMADIENTLIKEAEQKLKAKMSKMGKDPNSEEGQQLLSPEKIKTLPEIEDFYNKNYTTLAEQWASKQQEIDEERFHMDELEERAFKDMLIADREFWHFKMLEDDYEVELWNPAITFYHKSPDVRYISQGNWAGKIEMMTAADVIDNYGWRMTQDQMESLEAIYPIRSAGYQLQGMQNDGSYYDATKSHDWNTGAPGLAYRQFTSMHDNFGANGGDIINWILGESEDYFDVDSAHLLRVTTAYWKSQRKLGHLTRIDPNTGDVTNEIIDETYKVLDKPIYNTQFIKNKRKDNLVSGDHIDWIWLNHSWGGVKIGPNMPSYWGQQDSSGVNPIYLGTMENKIRPLKYQFKGENTLYGCKLPVEGRVFTDRNTRSVSLVDTMKPFQIGYNIVNNQIADILVDELGTVVLLDHNTLPQHSMGEDWGKNNLAKAYTAMKDFSMLPLDTSMSNTENALNFQHFQVLNLEQTQRMLSRVQLANYFKQQAYELVGVSPQRMGQQIGQTDTATGIEQAVAGSYAQTEMYFVQHSDHLMPRVHTMRTDLAQFYNSTKQSIKLQTSTTNDERVFFQMNGSELLLRDIHVYCSTKANHRSVMEQMKQLALSNNTSGASIYDLGNIIESDSMGTLNNVLKGIETKQRQEQQGKMQHESEMKDKEIEAMAQEKQLERDYDARESEKRDRKDILIAEIKSAGFGAMQDINENQQSDYIDALDRIQTSNQYETATGLQRDKIYETRIQNSEKNSIEREKIAASKDIKNIDLAIAVENKNKYDGVPPKKVESKPKKNSKK